MLSPTYFMTMPERFEEFKTALMESVTNPVSPRRVAIPSELAGTLSDALSDDPEVLDLIRLVVIKELERQLVELNESTASKPRSMKAPDNYPGTAADFGYQSAVNAMSLHLVRRVLELSKSDIDGLPASLLDVPAEVDNPFGVVTDQSE